MENSPNNIDINFYRKDTYPSLIFKDRIAPLFIDYLKNQVQSGNNKLSNSKIKDLFKSYYGEEYKDLKKIYEAFGGNSEGFSPEQMISNIDAMRIPLEGRKSLFFKNHGNESSVFVSDLENIANPAVTDGIQRYTKFDPDSLYKTDIGENFMIGEYTDGKGSIGNESGVAVKIPGVEDVLEGLNRASIGKKHRKEDNSDVGMDIVSRYLPGNDKTYSSRLVLRDPHSLKAPIKISKESKKPNISSLSYSPDNNPSVELEEVSSSSHGLFQNVPHRYDDKITKSSIRNIQSFLEGSGKSAEEIIPVRKALAESVGRIPRKIDITGLPNSPEELYHKEVKPLDESQIPSKEELTESITKIRESMKNDNTQLFSDVKEMFRHVRMNNILSNFSEFESFPIQTKFYDHNSTSRKVKDALWSVTPFGEAAIAGNNRRLVGVGTDLSSRTLGLVPLVGGPAALYYGYKGPRQVRADMQGLDNPKVRKKLKELYEKGIEEIDAEELAKLLKMSPRKLFKKDWVGSMKKSFRHTFNDVPFEESQENFAKNKFLFKGKPGNAKIASQFLSESIANRSPEELEDLLKALVQRSGVGTQKSRFFREAKQSLGSALEQYYGTDVGNVWRQLDDFYVKNNIKPPSLDFLDPSNFKRYSKGVLKQTGDNANSGVYIGVQRGLLNDNKGISKPSLLRVDKGVDAKAELPSAPSEKEDAFVLGSRRKIFPGSFHNDSNGIGHTGAVVALGSGAGAGAAVSKVKDVVLGED